MEPSYTHLSSEDRAAIQPMLGQSCSVQAIARHLDRSPGTISREIRRNSGPPRQRASKAPRGG